MISIVDTIAAAGAYAASVRFRVAHPRELIRSEPTVAPGVGADAMIAAMRADRAAESQH